MLRYRTGIDRRTGVPLVGWADVQQALGVILTTLLEERIMRTTFGSEPFRTIGRNLTPPVVLDYIRHSVEAIHRWEPEYRVTRMQVTRLGRTGALGIGHSGVYYPEGRLGNYRDSEPVSAVYPLAASAAA